MESDKVVRCDRGLLAATKPHSLIDYAICFGVKAVAVAVWTNDGVRAYDGITAFTYLILGRIIGNFLGLVQSGLLVGS